MSDTNTNDILNGLRDISLLTVERYRSRFLIETIRHIEKLEARNKELKGALNTALNMAHDMIELNPSNYDHDDVCRLNTESVELYNYLMDLHAEAINNE